MERAELAARLVAADGETIRKALLKEYAAIADARLAYELNKICHDGLNSEPARVIAAAAVLDNLAGLNHDPEVIAFNEWSAGMAALVAGQMERAIKRLEKAEASFLKIGKAHAAASTQVIKLFALAMLGRYDEAIECGLRARSIRRTQ